MNRKEWLEQYSNLRYFWAEEHDTERPDNAERKAEHLLFFLNDLRNALWGRRKVNTFFHHGVAVYWQNRASRTRLAYLDGDRSVTPAMALADLGNAEHYRLKRIRPPLWEERLP